MELTLILIDIFRFGVIFYLFNVDLNDESKHVNSSNNVNDFKNGLLNSTSDVYHNQNNDIMTNMRHDNDNNFLARFMPGPPFVFGSLMVVCAILVAIFIKEENPVFDAKRTSIVGERKSKTFVSVLVLFYLFIINKMLTYKSSHIELAIKKSSKSQDSFFMAACLDDSYYFLQSFFFS